MCSYGVLCWWFVKPKPEKESWNIRQGGGKARLLRESRRLHFSRVRVHVPEMCDGLLAAIARSAKQILRNDE